MSNSNQHQLSICLETTYGVTPATPSFLLKPITGTNIALTKTSIETAVISPQRLVTEVRDGRRQVGGNVDIEFAPVDFDDMLEAVLCGTWTDNVLKQGITRRSFSILRNFGDLVTGQYPFHLSKGIEFDTCTIAVGSDKIVTAIFACMGRESIYLDAAPSGATYTTPSSSKPFDSFVGAVEIDGVATTFLTDINIVITNAMTPRFQLFDDKTRLPNTGKLKISGSLTAYFENSDLLVAFSSGTHKAIVLTLTSPNGDTFQLEMPSLHLTTGTNDVKGESDILIPIQFTSIADTEDNSALIVTRSY